MHIHMYIQFLAFLLNETGMSDTPEAMSSSRPHLFSVYYSPMKESGIPEEIVDSRPGAEKKER